MVRRRSRGSGTIRQLPSGRYQAVLRQDGHHASRTVDTKAAAQGWLRDQRKAITDGTWAPPEREQARKAMPTFREYATSWLEQRPLKPRTRAQYQRMLDVHLDPKWGSRRLDSITVEQVRLWHRKLLIDKPTMRAQVYSLLRTIMGTAWQEDVIDSNPCRVRGAGSTKRRTRTDVPTATQVLALADALPSQKYRMMTLVAAWSGLRFGEITELRGKDIGLDPQGVPVEIRVRRAVVHVSGEAVIGAPKSEAGVRDVTIPPHIRAEVAAYLRTIDGDEALLFPARHGGHMVPGTLYKVWYRARARVGLPNLRFHDLRHFSATTAAQTGATIAELQARLGHSTTQAAMRYQHAASGRDAEIAEAMSNAIPSVSPDSLAPV